jgi:hypothetical protein
MRKLGIVIALAAGVFGFAGCGSSSKPQAAVSVDSGVRFADCMRAHGISNFPDPGTGGGVQINAAPGMNPASPAFGAAQKACGGGAGGPGAVQMTEAEKV